MAQNLLSVHIKQTQKQMPNNSNSSSYTYFAQFDWLEKKLYTSINSISRNLGTIFLPLTPEICINIDIN